MVLPAPPRLSITIGCLSDSLSLSEMARAMTLVLPPGVNGTISVIGCAGESLARAFATGRAQAAVNAASNDHRIDAVMRLVPDDAEVFHHFRPAGLLGVDVGGVLLRRARRWLRAFVADALDHGVVGERLVERLVELRDDRGRRPGGRGEAVAQRHVETGQPLLRHGRNIRHLAGAFGGGDGERADQSALDRTA